MRTPLSFLAIPKCSAAVGWSVDADTVEFTSLWFQLNGHETRGALDGEDVLRETENFDPHLIFLDVAMAKMDGYAVTRAIRDRHGWLAEVRPAPCMAAP